MFLLALGRLISLISGWAGRNRTAAPVFASMLTVSLLLSTGTSPAWGGSFLAHCPGDGGGGDRLTVTAAAPAQPGCRSLAMPIDAESVLAVLPAPRRPANAPEPETVAIMGVPGQSGFDIREVTVAPVSFATPAPYFVPGIDLRAVASVGPLGPLGRATLDRSGDDTTLDCTAGSEPAGLAFSTARVPPIPGMAIRVVHTAEHNFRVVVATPGAPAGGEPRLLAKLRAADSATEAYLPLPPDLPADTPLDIEVLCPATGGHLSLSEIVLEAKTTVPPERSSWVRDPRRWLENPADVFTRAQRWGLTRLYIRIPMSDRGLADPQALAGFVTAASSHDIAVWALLSEGDTGDSERAPLLRSAAALADYNAAVPPDAQIKGTEVEYAPSRLWRYSADPGAEARAFLDRLQPLRPVLGMPLAAAIPAWFPTDASIAERLASVLDAMTVITDRTELIDIRRSVGRFLAWGTRRGRPVEVALEAAPLADGERGRYERAEAGELWLIPFDGGGALVLLKESAANLPGLAFHQEEVAPVPAATRSFAGRPAELREAINSLGRTLGAWPSLSGFAFHGFFQKPP